jgi:hypothetical protein
MGLKQMITHLHVEWYGVEDRHDGASVVNLVLRASARSGCKAKRLIADIRSFHHFTPNRTATSGEFEAFEKLEGLTINAIAPQVLVTEEGLFTCLVLILAIPKYLSRLELSQGTRFSRRSHDHLDSGRRARWLTVARCIATHLSHENLV